jgi:purine-binding chemotaxis protein CheW
VDFPKIRKKARERAAAGRAAREAALDAPLPATPPADPVLAPEDVLDGELAARLQGLPAPAAERFTTWRPGSGEPPRLEPSPPSTPPAGDLPAVAGLRGALRPIQAPRRREDAPPPPRDPLDEFFYREDEEAPPIPTFGGPAEAEADAEAEASGARAEYLTFLVGGELYALPIERVREVLKAPAITEVPRAPAHVVGVVTVRGEIVAVCDPRRRLELPGPPPDGPTARLVIVDAGEGPCALLVDAIASVVRIARDGLEPCPQGIGGAAAECLAGIGRDGDRLFTALDLGALLRRAEAPPRGAGEEDRRAGA